MRGSYNIVFNLPVIETIHSAGSASWTGKKEISDQIFGLPGDTSELLDVVVTYYIVLGIFGQFSNRMITLPFKIIRWVLYFLEE